MCLLACALRCSSGNAAGRAEGAVSDKELLMSKATIKRGEGAAEELGGKIKAGVGKVIGNEQMELEGRAKQAKGVAKQEAAKGSERLKGKVEEGVGRVKNAAGAILDDDELEADGAAQEALGEARQDLNR
jgi:uncharacterized protein YjbJ (UPF0337 family)